MFLNLHSLEQKLSIYQRPALAYRDAMALYVEVIAYAHVAVAHGYSVREAALQNEHHVGIGAVGDDYV